MKSLFRRIRRDRTSHDNISQEEYDRLLLAIDLAIRAGNTAMMYYRNSLKENITLDDRKNAATQADLAAQNKVKPIINLKYETDDIISEESHKRVEIAINNKYTWVIDPLDGTNNFVSRIPLFCSGIGVLKEGNPFIGVIYDPVSNEVFYGIQGQQAQNWKVSSGDTIPISADSSVTKLDEALIGTHVSSRAPVTRRLFKKGFFLNVSQSVKHVRAFGCGLLALAYVASGRLQVFFQFDSYLWDQVAGVVLIQCSGGKVTQLKRNMKEWDYNTADILACSNGPLLEEFVSKHL